MKKIVLVAFSAMILAACTSSTTPMSDTTPANENVDTTTQVEQTNPTMQPLVQPTVVQLAAQKNSGQTGTATFTDLGEGRTKVTLSLTGGNFPDPQPAHIHLGTCVKPGEVQFPLTNVVNGMSETTLDTPMSSLWTGTMVVNVHKSAKESTVYTACAELLSSNSSLMQPTQSPAPAAPQGY